MPTYKLIITSWENDADHYMKQKFKKLTEADVRLLIGVAQLFRSMNSRENPGFGGGSWHWRVDGVTCRERHLPDAWAAVKAEVAKHPNASPNIIAMFAIDEEPNMDEDEIADGISDVISEIVGYPVEDMYQTEGYFRCFDSFKVKAVNVDVTDQFKS